MSLKNLRKKIREEKKKQENSTSTQTPKIPEDPVEFCRKWLFYEPYPYIWPFLRDKKHFIANVQARQTGKTFNGMAKLLYLALSNAGSLILVTAPKFDQVKNIAFKALIDHLQRMKAGNKELFETVCGDRNLLKTLIRLRNGSTLLAESPVPETIRGHTAKAVYMMEANFISQDQDLYTAVLFTLNTTNGYLLAESTPWNTDSVFYKMFHDPAYNSFSKHKVQYTQAMLPNGPLNQDIIEMIEMQLAGDSARWKREMLCEWTEDRNAWLPTSLITLALDSNIDYWKADEPQTGSFYMGVDFGKHRDNSVVVIIEKIKNHLYIRHLHSFPLETSYGAVIGYVKLLQDSWKTIQSIYADKTGVGEYIVEDMKKGGIRNIEGINFTEQTKEAMATALKEQMRKATCTKCSWTGNIDTREGEWRTNCPKCNTNLRPLLHIPYDPELLHQLNTPRYELSKTGHIQYNHPEGTHDDKFWATALATHAAINKQTSKPTAKTIY